MATWIQWAPGTAKEKFHQDFIIRDPLDLYANVEHESCSVCGFTVAFHMHKDDLANWLEDTHETL